jgi:hypothetical protein
MAKTARDDLSTPRRARFDMRSLRRLAAWGGWAALSLTFAVLAASSEPGSQRLAALGAGKATAVRSVAANGAQPAQPQSDADAKRLADAVRILAADRDRMLARINSLEQNLDDATGAIKRPSPPGESATPAAPAKPPNPNVASASPQTVPSAEQAEAPPPSSPRSIAIAPFPNWAATTPLLGVPSFNDDDGPPPWPEDAAADADGLTAGIGAERSVLTKTEFGADIGGAINIGALKSLWASARNTYAPLLERLRPVIAVREVRPGSVELRLIVGPLANAGAAARLCAALTANGRSCRPAVFDGQRLALR